MRPAAAVGGTTICRPRDLSEDHFIPLRRPLDVIEVAACCVLFHALGGDSASRIPGLRVLLSKVLVTVTTCGMEVGLQLEGPAAMIPKTGALMPRPMSKLR